MDKHLNQTNDTFFYDNKCHLSAFFYLSQGWDLCQVDQVKGMPKNDLYGKLYMHVAVRLEKLAKCLQNGQVTVEMYMCNAMKLPQTLKGQMFDVIDVANACDNERCGPSIIPTLAPLLNKTNPDATIVSCFMTWETKLFDDLSTYLPKTQQAFNKTRDYLQKNGKVSDHVDDDTLNTMATRQSQWIVDMGPLFKPLLPKFPKSKIRSRDVHRIVPKRMLGSMSDYKMHRDSTALDFVPWYSLSDVFVEWELCP
jgi:hypothetical protein